MIKNIDKNSNDISQNQNIVNGYDNNNYNTNDCNTGNKGELKMF